MTKRRAPTLHEAGRWTRARAYLALALALAAVAVLTPAGGGEIAHAQQPGTPGAGWQGGAPSDAGVHAALWGGGTIEQAAATPGVRSLWVAVGGRLVGYVAGAPGFVNAGFRAHFPDGTLPDATPVVLVIGMTEDRGPTVVVDAFMADLAAAAPPSSSEPALVRALSRLTDETRARLASSGQLAAFVGVQDLPDRGVTTALQSQTATEARVLARLQYSGGDAEREFLLLRERDRWRIDWVDVRPLTAAATPELVVEAFLAHFIAAAPPATATRPAVRASELLTASARAGLNDAVPLSSALAAFVGVQDVPDMGFDVSPAVVSGEAATVTATLHYSGSEAARTFDLEREAGAWRIAAAR